MTKRKAAPAVYYVVLTEVELDRLGLNEYGTEEQAVAAAIEEIDVRDKPVILKVIGHLEAPIVSGTLIRYKE